MKETGYIKGEWRAVCDSCGFEFLGSELKLRWDGMRVCEKDWETRHPQEFVRGKPENMVPPWVRPADSVTQVPVMWVDGPRRVTWVDGISTVDWYEDI